MECGGCGCELGREGKQAFLYACGDVVCSRCVKGPVCWRHREMMLGDLSQEPILHQLFQTHDSLLSQRSTLYLDPVLLSLKQAITSYVSEIVRTGLMTSTGWSCAQCSAVNRQVYTQCLMCNQARYPPETLTNDQYWACQTCQRWHNMGETECLCGYKKEIDREKRDLECEMCGGKSATVCRDCVKSRCAQCTQTIENSEIRCKNCIPPVSCTKCSEIITEIECNRCKNHRKTDQESLTDPVKCSKCVDLQGEIAVCKRCREYVTCSQCQSEVSCDKIECETCQKKRFTLICQHCHEVLPQNRVFCSNCPPPPPKTPIKTPPIPEKKLTVVEEIKENPGNMHEDTEKSTPQTPKIKVSGSSFAHKLRLTSANRTNPTKPTSYLGISATVKPGKRAEVATQPKQPESRGNVEKPVGKTGLSASVSRGNAKPSAVQLRFLGKKAGKK